MRRTKQGLAVGAILFLAVFSGLFVMFLSLVKEAEGKMGSLDDKVAAVSRPPTRILTSDGVELYRVSAENRIPLKLSQIPPHVRNAVIAAEDKRFYEHNGVDEQGLMRAFVSVFKEGRVSQGGSTITMQLAKRLYNGSERSFKRKMEDIAYAYEIERYLGNKNRILELYLNQVYFGEGAHGIGAAAKVYLNKDVKNLTISDAALLSRCVRLPSKENPIKDLKVAMQNRDVVLGVMRTERMITEDEYEKAIAEQPKINKHPPETTAFYSAGYGQYAVQHALAQIEKDKLGIDLKSGGYTIYLNVDSQLQRVAEKSVHNRVNEYRRYKVNQGMVVAIDADGRILCEVGGPTFDKKHQYNNVTQGHMQPGSGFKPFLYATALRDGVIEPNSWLSNAPISLPNGTGGKMWTPVNSSPRENEPGYSLATALAMSVNRPAVHTILKVGPNTVAQAAHDVFGFRSELQPYPPLALGSSAVNPLEMAEGYSVFMLRGDRVRPFVISKIVGPDGQVVKEYYPEKFTNVFDARICEEMDVLLRGVVEHGTGYPAHDVPNARGKTGTTNSAKDAWFNGYADGVFCTAWVGNQRLVKGIMTELPMAGNVYGGTTAINIWRDVMHVARPKFARKLDFSGLDAGTIAAIPAPKKPRPHRDPEDGVVPAVNDSPVKDEPKPVKLPDETPDPASAPPTTDENPPRQDPPVKPPVDTIGGGDKGTPPATGNEDIDNPKPKPRRERPKRPRDEDEQTVTVEVCADSGEIATAYCPETVTRTFAKGHAPRRRCHIHRPGG